MKHNQGLNRETVWKERAEKQIETKGTENGRRESGGTLSVCIRSHVPRTEAKNTGGIGGKGRYGAAGGRGYGQGGQGDWWAKGSKEEEK